MVSSKRMATLFALTLALLPAAPLTASAQAQPVVSFTGANVNIEADKGDFQLMLKQLFKTGERSYVIDPMVKNASLSLSIHNLPFNVALETLLKASGLPLTYHVENGVYTILERKDEPSTQVESNTIQIRATNLNATALLTWLKTIKRFGPESHLTFSVTPNNDVLLVTYPETDESYALVNEVQKTVQLADVKPINIALKLEVIVLGSGKGAQTRHTLLSTTLRTFNGQMAHAKIGNESALATEPTEGVEANRLNAELKPLVDKNANKMNISTSGTLDVAYRMSGEEKSHPLHIDFSSVGDFKLNEPGVLESTVVKRQSGKGAEQSVQIEILITPELVPEDTPMPLLHPAP